MITETPYPEYEADKKEAEADLEQVATALKNANIHEIYDEFTALADMMLKTSFMFFAFNDIKVVRLFNEIALFHARRESPGYAVHFIVSAISFWKEHPQTVNEDTVHTYLRAGMIFTIDEYFAVGRDAFAKAHQLLKQIGAEKSEQAAEVLCFEAELYITRDDYETALEKLQKSLDMLEELKIEKTYFKGRCLLNIAKIFRFRKKIRDALTYYNMSAYSYLEYFGKGHPIIEPVMLEYEDCVNSVKEEKGSEILDFGSENN